MPISRTRSRNRFKAGGVNVLFSLSMFNDLYIYEPANAQGDDLVVADTAGSAIVMQQTTSARRPTITGKVFESSNSQNDSRGLQTDQSITFKEIFIFTWCRI